MKMVLFLFLVLVGAPAISAEKTVIKTQNWNESPWGYTFQWSNSYQMRFGMYVIPKIKREVKKVSSDEKYGIYEVSLIQSEFPQEVLKNYQLPKKRFPLNCKLGDEFPQVSVLKFTQWESAFPLDRPFDQMSDSPEDDDLEIFEKITPELIAMSKKLCQVHVKVPLGMDVNILDQPHFIKSGVPALSVSLRTVVKNEFSEITQPYIEFFSDPSVQIQTDDEFWFIGSTVIFKDSQLNAFFASEAREKVYDFLYHFNKYVFEKIPYRESKEEFNQVFNKVSLQDSYELTIMSDEVIYEF